MIRAIVTINEELCDGCGVCIPACHEGALRIINGKAKLVSDNLCDGLGDCLGHCPRGAITVEHREANEFDEAAVEAQRSGPSLAAARAICPSTLLSVPDSDGTGRQHIGGCPGAHVAQFTRKPGVSGTAPDRVQRDASGQLSELTHWPVQLHLLPPTAPMLKGARLLVAADCVPVAHADFHSQLLRDRVVVIACPKLDDTSGYVEKLTALIKHNDLEDITVARLEVPCCGGILQSVVQAHQNAESHTPLHEIVISTRGRVISQHRIA